MVRKRRILKPSFVLERRGGGPNNSVKTNQKYGIVMAIN
jgi:hypothetical protein